MRGLFLHGQHAAVLVKLHDAEAFGVVDIVAEDGGQAVSGVGHGLAQHAGKTVAVEDVVAQDHGARLTGDEFLADQKRLGQPVG